MHFTCCLDEDPVLEELERNQQWKETIVYCIEKYDRNNCEANLLRLITQAWYLCSFIEQLPPYNRNPLLIDINFSDLCKIIQETTARGADIYDEDPIFLCMTGYMMSTIPEWFVNQRKNYNDCKNQGKANLRKAKILNPKLCALFDVASKREGSEIEACTLFPGNSEVDVYFKSVITGDDLFGAD